MGSSLGHKRYLSDDDEHSMPHALKRRKPTLAHDDYAIGWVAALHIERAAAEAMLDEIHQKLPQKEGDTNNYTFGRIGDHNIVITSLPDDAYGTVNAATVAGNMNRTFPSLRMFLMVGIAGGTPGNADVRLGDVVVGTTLVQYDLGKAVGEGHFQSTAIPHRTTQELRNAVSALRAQHVSEPSKISTFLHRMSEQTPRMEAYTSRDSLQDLLFESTYEHPELGNTCNKCDRSKLVERTLRPNNSPMIHYGVIASGNQVIKYAKKRDELARQFKALCFEMEGAGFIESLQCLVIRSICDYADSHKNKQWQQYAAAVAAAYTKELLGVTAALEPQASKTDQIEALIKSLSFGSIAARKWNIKPAYGKTCEWILHHPTYLAWLDLGEHPQHHGFLWIRGKPGAGKSTLMKFILTNLKKDFNAISFFFNARGDKLDKSTEGMFRSLLFQLLQMFPDLQRVLEDPCLLCEASIDSIKWDIGTLQHFLSKAITQLGQRQLICFVDALDECNESEVYEMVDYFEELGAFASEKNVKIFTCFSSRHYPSTTIKTGLALTLEDQIGHSQDLEEYVSQKLNIGNGEQALKIRRDLVWKASGVFMWVVLVVGILNKEYQQGRIFAVKKKLNEIPTKLSELFKDILQKDNENLDELKLSIQWILYADHPLRPEEYYYAMLSGLDPEEDNLAKWDREQITIESMNRFVSSSSKGLAEVTNSYRTVQFIHESVRNFLLEHGGIHELWPDQGNGFESWSHDRLKECCQAYLQARAPDVKDLPKSCESYGFAFERPSAKQVFPFIAYAAEYVLCHCEKAATSFPQRDFLDSFDFSTWIGILGAVFSDLRYTGRKLCQELLRLLTSQNCARRIESAAHNRLMVHDKENTKCLSSKLNSDKKEAADVLLQPRGYRSDAYHMVPQPLPKIESILIHAYTLLKLPISCSDILLAQLLLDRGAEVDAKDNEGRTPLSWAAISYFESTGMIELLLNKGAEINTKDNNGQTPLMLAADKKNIEAMKLLLDKGSEVDKSDNAGRTPLSWVASGPSSSSIKLVQLLLDRGAEVDAKDNEGRTPLSGATSSIEFGIELVQLLVDRGAEVDTKDNKGRTPLSWAACNFSDSAAKAELLLDKGAKINTKDDKGRTPLSWAAYSGANKAAQLLLDRGAEIDAKDNEGRTPLSWAAECWDSKVAQLLLDRGAEIDAKDNEGRTPLSWAANTGASKVAQLLLAQGAEIDVSNDNGMTPLDLAENGRKEAQSEFVEGYEKTIELLKACGSSIPNVTSKVEV